MVRSLFAGLTVALVVFCLSGPVYSQNGGDDDDSSRIEQSSDDIEKLMDVLSSLVEKSKASSCGQKCSKGGCSRQCSAGKKCCCFESENGSCFCGRCS